MRASYRRALRWVLENEDLAFLTDTNHWEPTSVALIADLWGKTTGIVKRDLAAIYSR